MSDHPSNRPSADNLEDIFTYHAPGDWERNSYEKIRDQAKSLAAVILERCPPCADTSAAIRKVREAVMIANAAIALEPPE